MALNAPAANVDRVLPPEGSHVARTYSLVELGTIPGYQEKLQHKIRLSFELPNELHEFKEGEGEKPFSISQEYTLSVNEKANLRKLLHSVVGKSLSDSEAEAYNLEDLVGKPLVVTVVHKKGDRGEFAVIEGTSPIMKGTEVPEQVNKSVLLTFLSFDKGVFENLPDFIREKIESSLEYKNEKEKKGLNDDEIPF